jgi:hypothetical protein
VHVLVRFIAIIAGIVALMGVAIRAYLVMIGVPATAGAILIIGFLHRYRPERRQAGRY